MMSCTVWMPWASVSGMLMSKACSSSKSKQTRSSESIPRSSKLDSRRTSPVLRLATLATAAMTFSSSDISPRDGCRGSRQRPEELGRQVARLHSILQHAAQESGIDDGQGQQPLGVAGLQAQVVQVRQQVSFQGAVDGLFLAAQEMKAPLRHGDELGDAQVGESFHQVEQVLEQEIG